MKATHSNVPEQPKLKFNLVGQTDLLISTVLLASRQQAIKYKCGHLNFSQIGILAMQTYVPSSRYMRFPERSNDTLQGKSLSVCVASGIDPDTQMPSSQESKVIPPLSMYCFFWIDVLA